MHTTKRVNAPIMWANIHLLFWLSLVPFATGWMGRTNFDKITVAVYGVLLILCGFAFTILRTSIKKSYHETTELSKVLAKGGGKELVSIVLYSASIPVALFVHPFISAILFAIVSIMWLIPSKEIERALEREQQ
jgi:uncharacterized membrane protein